MQPVPTPTAIRTAIPPRYERQRERVLRILTRWQASLATPRLSPAGSR
ncbi:MAG TPA: hypothetical protein VLD58_10885 [Gemmatimonadales bacterium]|nr:hypothetical protein [Gemmatimonadales bacterium]